MGGASAEPLLSTSWASGGVYGSAGGDAGGGGGGFGGFGGASGGRSRSGGGFDADDASVPLAPIRTGGRGSRGR